MKALLVILFFILSNTLVFAEEKNESKLEPKYAYAEVLIKLFKDGHHEVVLKKSSGRKQLDEKILNAVKEAKFKPITDKDLEYVYLTQPFTIELDGNETKID